MKPHETAIMTGVVALVFATTFFLLGMGAEHKNTRVTWEFENILAYEKQNCTTSNMAGYLHSPYEIQNLTTKRVSFPKSCGKTPIWLKKAEVIK